jgi:ABC-type transport system involved in multi-copper enzyme maturation permease subunit
MPIYDASYRRYEARAPLRSWRFWPITREALRRIVASRTLLLLLLVSWIPFLFRVAQVFVAARMPELAPLLAVDARLFDSFLGLQVYFALMLTLFGGAGLIANDLNSGGLLLYFARAISRRDYVLGKLLALAALNLCVTLAPAALLYFLATALLPQRLLTWDLAWLPLSIAAQSLLITSLLSLMALACSSLTQRTWLAGAVLFATLLGLDLTQASLRLALGLDAAALLSPLSALRIAGHALFGGTAGALHWAFALVALVSCALGALAVLRWRVRAVEVVA